MASFHLHRVLLLAAWLFTAACIAPFARPVLAQPAAATSTTLEFVVNGNSVTTTGLTVNPSGSTAAATIQIASSRGFIVPVNFSCVVTYQGTGTAANPPTCSMNTATSQVTTPTALSSTLTVSTVAGAPPAQLIFRPPQPTSNGRSGRSWVRSSFAMAGLLVLGWLPRRRWRGSRLMLLLICGCGLTLSLSGCGRTNGAQATAGSYSVIVTATSATVTASTTIPLTVK